MRACSPRTTTASTATIGRIAREEGVAESGYRILSNHGAAAHQEVQHFHLHLFGGRDLGPMLRRVRG